MKSLVIYYSHYGNTAAVAQKLSGALCKMGEADIFQLEYVEGSKNVLIKLLYRLMPSLVKISCVPTDLKHYDVLCLGTPVLMAHPSSAILKYINMCKNIDRKRIICCYVYGMEASAKVCSAKVEKVLRKKGKPDIISMYVSWLNISNEQLLDKTISAAMEKLS
jgi:menaquinone-dependent protoporphyrinogen IX oxidase